MSQLYILFEHASGFAIFRTTEFEEVAVFLPQVRESITNVSKFRSNVFFVAFQSFKEQKDALTNMQSITSGELSTELQLFLENNIPRTKKSKQPIMLGVEEPELSAAISDKLDIKCLSSGLVLEIIRGIRFHFFKLVKGFKDENLGTQAQLSLAHHYSRAKLNFDATRQDCMIIESNNLVDELEKDINTLGKRVRQWYAFHFPELFKIVNNDTELYVRCVNVFGDRKNLPEDIEEKLHAVLGDSYNVETILLAAHNSMGTAISPVDLENLKMLCRRIISLINRRQSTIKYLKSKMNHTAPNVSSLLGEMIGSRLISRAGGLEKLAKLPSSTVQVLGAEKKFFRTLKDRKEKVPVSGLLSNSAFMGKAGKKKKGRLAKILANKCSLAARVDCFSKTRKEAFGKQLVHEVENCIKYVKKVKIQEDINKETPEKAICNQKKSLNKKSKKGKKIKDLSSMETSGNSDSELVNNSSVLNGTENSKIQIAPSDKTKETVQNQGQSCATDTSVKLSEGKNSEVIIEELSENHTEKSELKSSRIKRKSKSVRSFTQTEDISDETSEILEDSEEKKPLKRRKTRSSKKK